MALASTECDRKRRNLGYRLREKAIGAEGHREHGRGGMAKKVRLCENCGAENLDEAKFCKNCGRRFYADDSGALNQNVMQSPRPQPHHQDEATNRTDLVLAVILVLVGIVIVASSVLQYRDSDVQDHELRSILASLGANAFILAFVGIGITIFWWFRRSAFLIPESKAEKSETGSSSFHVVERSPFCGAIFRSRTDARNQRADIPLAVRVFLYLVCICTPGFGCVAGGALMANERPKYRIIGRRCLKIAVISLAIMTMMVAIGNTAVNYGW